MIVSEYCNFLVTRAFVHRYPYVLVTSYNFYSLGRLPDRFGEILLARSVTSPQKIVSEDGAEAVSRDMG